MGKRNLIYLFGATFFSYTTICMLIPTFPAYILDLGGNKAQIGLTSGAFMAGILAFRPVVGRLTDIRGRRWVALLGTLIFFVSPLLYAAFPSIPTLYLIRFFHGIGSAAFTTAFVTLVTDCTTRANRGHTLGLMGASNNLGLFIGPWMGSQLVDLWGYQAMFVAAAGLGLISFLAALPIRELVTPLPRHKAHSYPNAVLKRSVLFPSSLLFVGAIIYASIVTFLPVFLKERPLLSAGAYFMVLSVTMLIVRLFARPILNSRSHRPVISLSLLGMIAGIGGIIQARNATWMVMAAIVFGFGFATIRPVLTTFLASHTAVNLRGTVFAFYEGAYDLGMALSSVFLGFVADSFDLVVMFYVVIVIGGIGQCISAGLTDDSVRETVEWAVVLKEEQSIHQ